MPGQLFPEGKVPEPILSNKSNGFDQSVTTLDSHLLIKQAALSQMPAMPSVQVKRTPTKLTPRARQQAQAKKGAIGINLSVNIQVAHGHKHSVETMHPHEGFETMSDGQFNLYNGQDRGHLNYSTLPTFHNQVESSNDRGLPQEFMNFQINKRTTLLVHNEKKASLKKFKKVFRGPKQSYKYKHAPSITTSPSRTPRKKRGAASPRTPR